jgi:hypothetical protein
MTANPAASNRSGRGIKQLFTFDRVRIAAAIRRHSGKKGIGHMALMRNPDSIQ